MITNTAEKMRIDIWSDIMCPFCFIGKRIFDQALDGFEQKENIQVVWRSFHLFPGVRHEQGRDACSVLAEVKGLTPKSMREAMAHVVNLGKPVKIQFDFDRLQMVNTHDALRLVHLGAHHDRGSEMKERLFQAFFEEGKNLEEHETLAQLGKEVGLDPQAVKTMLSSDAYHDEVKQDIAMSKELGVSGIPFFVFNQQYALSGSRSLAAFQDLLKETFADWAQKNADRSLETMAGDSCSIDGHCD